MYNRPIAHNVAVNLKHRSRGGSPEAMATGLKHRSSVCGLYVHVCVVVMYII